MTERAVVHPLRLRETIHVDGRLAAIGDVDPEAPRLVQHLLSLATRGLATAYEPASGEFAQTVRGRAGGAGAHVQREGSNTRYDAMAALGLGRLSLRNQRRVLDGHTAAQLTEATVRRAEHSPDAGAVALAAWASAEVTGVAATPLLARLTELLMVDDPLPTVDTSWALTAAVASAGLADSEQLVWLAIARLLRHQGPGDTWPHLLPPSTMPRWRAHVGSFADQVYPLQALARASVLTGEATLLEAADHTADRLCALQGSAGQWWWHYDARDGSVVEPYPVYSVHQHAMAPMVLLDLLEAGGQDHRREVAAGLSWLDRHPEVVEELVSDRFGLVWRKVGRREPPKAARALGAATTSVRSGFHLPLDRLLPPVVVDHECRPYELGWLLYAWLSPRARLEGHAHGC